MLTFLAHQMLISLDAGSAHACPAHGYATTAFAWGDRVPRAEIGGHTTHVARRPIWDGLPVLGPCGLRPAGLACSDARLCRCIGAILLLWASSKLVIALLNPAATSGAQCSPCQGMNGYFAAPRCTLGDISLSSAPKEHSWLIPDNVQEEPPCNCSASPTEPWVPVKWLDRVPASLATSQPPNLPQQDFADTGNSLEAANRYRGTYSNWYDTRSLVATGTENRLCCRSGNLVASLWTSPTRVLGSARSTSSCRPAHPRFSGSSSGTGRRKRTFAKTIVGLPKRDQRKKGCLICLNGPRQLLIKCIRKLNQSMRKMRQWFF